MPRLDIDMALNLARLQQDANKAVGLVDRAFRDMKSAGAQVKNIFGVFGVGLGAYQVQRFIRDQINAADAMHDLAARTGIAVETLAGLDQVAKKSGTSLESLANANKKLSQYAIEAQLGAKENQKVLAALGITARDPTQRLYQMADAIKSIEDPTLRQAIALKTMGKNGDAAIPALLAGGAALQKLVEKGQQLSGVTAENAAQADKFNDDLADMSAEAGKVGLAIGTKLIPPLTAFLKAINRTSHGRGFGFGINLAYELAIANAKKLADIKVPPLQFDLNEFLDPARKSFAQGNFFPGGGASDSGITRAICQQMGGVWDGEVCNLEAGKFNDRIKKQIAGIYGDTFAALRQEARQGGFLPLVEPNIRLAEAAKNAADAMKYKNDQAEIAINADISNKQSTEDFIRSLRLSNEDMRFQTSLFGLSTVEQEKLTAARRVDLDVAERIRQLNQDAPTYRSDVDQLQADAATARRVSGELIDAQREASRSFNTGFSEGLHGIIADATNTAAQVKGLFVNMFSGMENALVNFVHTGKLEFKNFANSVLDDLLRIAIQQQITAPLAQSLFGAGGFGGGRASGGPVAAGVPYMVGERGEELFVPKSAGTIVPNDKLGGSSVTVNMINQTGSPIAAKSGAPRFDGEKFVVDVVMRNIENNGVLRTALAR